jgi:hypothetical protein
VISSSQHSLFHNEIFNSLDSIKVLSSRRSEVNSRLLVTATACSYNQRHQVRQIQVNPWLLVLVVGLRGVGMCLIYSETTMSCVIFGYSKKFAAQ